MKTREIISVLSEYSSGDFISIGVMIIIFFVMIAKVVKWYINCRKTGNCEELIEEWFTDSVGMKFKSGYFSDHGIPTEEILTERENSNKLPIEEVLKQV